MMKRMQRLCHEKIIVKKILNSVRPESARNLSLEPLH